MSVQSLLGLKSPPVAVAYLEQPPANVPKWGSGAVPAGCAFWQRAVTAGPFFTEQADHLNCAVGCHTHNIPLPEARAHELMDTVGFMVKSGYLTMEEVPGIPTLKKSPRYVAYAPIEQASFAPDVVVVAARPGQLMLLQEAALKCGAGNALGQTLGRPGCAVLPLTVNSGKAAMSLGCKGNRLFTGTPEDEMYFSIPGAHWKAFEVALVAILEANVAMQEHYEGKLKQFPMQ